MRIGVFTNVLQHRPSGIGWHVIHLLNHLARVEPAHEYFLFYRTSLLGPRASEFQPRRANFNLVPIPTPDIAYQQYFRLFDRWLLPRAIRRHGIDLFHGPNHYLPERGRAAQVVTFHDVAEATLRIFTPAHRDRQQAAVLRTARRADHVIALSHSTRDDLVRLGCDGQRISVIYQGGNVEAMAPASEALVAATRQRFALYSPYLLFVGAPVGRKNLALLLRAFARLRRGPGPRVQLTLAGDHDNHEGRRLVALAGELGIAGDVVFTGYLDNNQLRGLYGGAAAAVIPSFHEGFGMTALEAMAYDLPLVATRGGALPEVIDDAGLLVEVDDESALAEALRRVLTEPSLADELRRRGRQRLRAFNWETTARQTLSLYRRLAPQADAHALPALAKA